MNQDIFILEKRQRTVRLDDSHSFIMREMGAEAVRRYSQAIIEAGQKAKSAIQNSADVSVDAAMRVATDAEILLLMELLSEPVNPSAPATEEFCRNLSWSQRVGLFKLQNELNGMDELLKNLESLLAL